MKAYTDKQCGAPLWTSLMIAFVCACLVVSVGRYFANNMGELMSTMLLYGLSCAFVGLTLVQTRLLRQPAFLILAALFVLTFLSSALSEKFYGAFQQNGRYLGTLIVSIGVCYALAFVLPDGRRERALQLLVGISAAIVSLVCLAGVILASCGVYYRPAFMPEYGLGLCPPEVGMGADWRLVTFTHPNTVGMVCSIVLLLSVTRIITLRRTAGMVLYTCAAAICFAAIALAASRTSSLAVSIGLAMIVFRLLYRKLSARKSAVRWILSLLAAAVTAVVCFAALDALCGGLLSLSEAGRSQAAAQTAAERTVVDETGAFAGRTNIWKGVFRCMTDTPRLFICGTSPVQVGAVIADYTPIWVQEVHSSFVQMLISCGVLCPLLFITFVVLLAVKGVRLFFTPPEADGYETGWLVPIAVAILVSACMETFLLLYPQLHFANLWFFILAGYIVRAADSSRTAKRCNM